MSELTLNEKRYYPGVDLLKVISMIMVVGLHVLGMGGILNASGAYTSVNFQAAWFLEIACYVAVNCFALATGFLMCGKRLKYRKIVPLWLTVVFYIVLFFAISKIADPNYMQFYQQFYIAPVISAAYWYFTAYCLLFFFIPFLNILVERCSKRMYLRLLFTGFLLVVLASSFSTVNRDPFKLSDGYSPWWLMYLYLLGAGIKKYDLFKKVTAFAALGGYAGFTVLTFLSKMGMHWMLDNVKNTGKFYILLQYIGTDRFVAYTSVSVICAAVCLALFCLKVKVPKFIHPLLKAAGPLVFQVYIIHLHPYIRALYVDTRFSQYGGAPLWKLVLAFALGTLIIFGACLAVDTARYWLFRLLRVEKLVNFFADKLTRAVNERYTKRHGSDKTDEDM